ncbi:hypothetical protein BJX65DRAFT_315300 [Aspergillus insuetus]
MDELAAQQKQQTEPIFELAVKCEVLYTNQITTLTDIGDENAAKVLSDMYQRFSAWATFLGVFAEPHVCLDRRLRRHPEIQDQVLLLLDIMQGNLVCLSGGDGVSAPEKLEALEPNEPSSAVSDRIQSLKAVSDALERLNQIGTAIRRSSAAKQTSKARELAETFDLTSFEQVAYMSLKALYSDCSESLVEHLTRSMVETYALFLHRKSRKARLERNRPRLAAHLPLQLIPEEPPVAQTDLHITEFDHYLSVQGDGAEVSTASPVPHQPARMLFSVPQSEPTSIDTQEVRARLKRILNPSTRSKPVSLLVNQVGYPRANKESLVCEWCFGPLMPDCLEGLKWQKHLNEDFKPYVCVSEKCSHVLLRFASSNDWLQHMVSEHGGSWHREVHAPSSWICPLCTETASAFSIPDSLSEHIGSEHGGVFKPQQIQAIVRQSRFPALRPHDICPLCCFPIGDDQSAAAKREGDKDEEWLKAKGYLPKPDVHGPKRIRIDIRDAQSNYDSIKSTTFAAHMTAHLQGIMLLTLRLISIEGPMNGSSDSQSSATDTNGQTSWVSSGSRNRDIDTLAGVWQADTELPDDTVDPEYTLPAPETVPDCDHMDWNHVPRSHEEVFDGQAETSSSIGTVPSAGRGPRSDTEWKRFVKHDLDRKLRLQEVKDNASRLIDQSDKIRFREVELQGLVNQFRSKLLDLQLLISYMTKYLSAAEGLMDALLSVVTAVGHVIDVSANDRVRKQRWLRQREAVMGVQKEQLPKHLEGVRQGVLNPLQKLYTLYNGPSLAIARLYYCNTTKHLIFSHAESLGEPPAQFYRHYMNALKELTLVVMHELPELYALTIQAVEKCLTTFTRLQTGWFKALRRNLEPLELFSPTALGDLVHWQHDSQIVLDNTLSRLAICNGSLLAQKFDYTEDRDSLISDFETALTSAFQINSTPGTLSKDDSETEQENDRRLLRTVTSYYARLGEPGRRQGIPLLEYDADVTFEVYDDQGEYWIARRLDTGEDQTIGWIHPEDFYLLSPLSNAR